MKNEDYSVGELLHIIEELLTTHLAKLKQPEIYYIEAMRTQLTPTVGAYLEPVNRDTLIGMYDRMGEANYD